MSANYWVKSSLDTQLPIKLEYETFYTKEKGHKIKHIINILGLILSSVLLFGEFKYYLSRPTYSSNNQEKIKPENFPDMLICPFPAFDLEKLAHYGYRSTYHFKIGQLLDGSDFVGWNGNSSSPVEKVIQDISLLESREDCPEVTAMFEDSKDVNLTLSLSSFVITHGRCCQPVVPTEAGILKLELLLISVQRKIMKGKKFHSFSTLPWSLSTTRWHRRGSC